MVLARIGGLFDSIKRDLMEYIHMEVHRLQAGVVEVCRLLLSTACGRHTTYMIGFAHNNSRQALTVLQVERHVSGRCLS